MAARANQYIKIFKKHEGPWPLDTPIVETIADPDLLRFQAGQAAAHTFFIVSRRIPGLAERATTSGSENWMSMTLGEFLTADPVDVMPLRSNRKSFVHGASRVAEALGFNLSEFPLGGPEISTVTNQSVGAFRKAIRDANTFGSVLTQDPNLTDEAREAVKAIVETIEKLSVAVEQMPFVNERALAATRRETSTDTDFGI